MLFSQVPIDIGIIYVLREFAVFSYAKYSFFEFSLIVKMKEYSKCSTPFVFIRCSIQQTTL